MSQEKEKRKSIRIKDKVLLSFHPVSVEEYQARVRDYVEGVDDPWVDTCHPIFNKDIKGHLKNLRDKDKDLAAILEALDQKLNLILGLVGSEELCGKAKLPKKLYKVDLSAKGIGFLTSEKIEKGTILDLAIGLLPEHYFFHCFGKVVRAESRNGGAFVGVKFLWITEDDQEKLIEHIFSRQVIYLRMRRLQRERKEKD